MSELVFTCTQLGQIPVHHAAFGGHLEVVKYLLELQPKTVSAEDNVSRAIFGHECITQACATLANDRLHSVIFRGVRWVHPPLPQIFWPWCKKTPICCTGCRWWEASIQKLYVRYAVRQLHCKRNNWLCKSTQVHRFQDTLYACRDSWSCAVMCCAHRCASATKTKLLIGKRFYLTLTLYNNVLRIIA